MVNSRILVQGKFYPNDVEIIFSDAKKRKIIPELEKKMELLWENKFLEMRQKGIRVWNGKNYRLNDFKIESGRLILDLGIIDYKFNSMMKLVPEFENLDEEFLAQGFFVCGLIRCADNFFVFGNLSGITPLSSFKKIDFIGGVAAPEDVKIDTGTKLFQMMFKELSEEINVPEQFIKNSYILGLVQTETYHVGSVFEINLSLHKDEVQKLFLENNDGEIGSLIFVAADDLRDFVAEVQGYGAAVADMLE